MSGSPALCSVSLLGARVLAGVLAASLLGCVLGNPGFDESESSDASAASAGATGVSAGSSATVTSDGSESSGISASGTTTTTTTTTTGTSEGSGAATTGAATTAASGESDGTSTGEMPALTCPDEDSVDVDLVPTENTYVVTSAGALCTWTDSNFTPVNQDQPCDILNFGGEMSKYTVIGRSGDSRGEYLVRFGVHQALLDYPGMGIAGAHLAIVPWWSNTRSDVVFQVGVVDYGDAWAPGDKVAMPALEGDSSWTSRKIEGVGLPWSSGDGPAAGSLDAATISLDQLVGGEHPVATSTPIPPSLLAPWVSDAGDEQGFVIYTEIEPILVKNKDTTYKPLLHLRLCPL